MSFLPTLKWETSNTCGSKWGQSKVFSRCFLSPRDLKVMVTGHKWTRTQTVLSAKRYFFLQLPPVSLVPKRMGLDGMSLLNILLVLAPFTFSFYLFIYWLFETPWTVTHQSPLSMNSPGQNTGVVSCSLSRGIFPTQGSHPSLLHCRQILYCLSHQENPRILDWVAYPFSREYSQPGNQTGVSCIAVKFSTSWATREAMFNNQLSSNKEESSFWGVAFVHFHGVKHPHHYVSNHKLPL